MQTKISKMLRQLRILASKNSSKWFSVKHLCTNQPKDEFITEPETNFVKLIGTAWNDSERLPTGDHFCKVIQRCYNENNQKFSISHILMVSPKLLELNNIDSLKRGQSFNVNGYVRSIPFETSHGRIRNAVSIVPYELRLYQDDQKPNEDVCIVMMTARIRSKIWFVNKVLMMDLKTHTPIRDKKTGFTGETNEVSHSVVVIDPHLQNYIRMHFNKGDNIHVEGYLTYREIEAADGRFRMCGNIVAVHVERVEKYKKSDINNDSDEE